MNLDFINLSSWVVSLGGILNEPIDALSNFINCAPPHAIEVGKCAITFVTEVGSNFLSHIPYIGG